MATRHANPPAAPQQQQPPHRRGISFSGKSDKSQRSSNSGPKVSLHETAEEKARRALHTKADPTLAMNEAQPATVAMEKSNLGSLRSMQHKDQYGNVITDPDLSNPTRPRLERPLDTIRSFEAAIDGSYHSRRMSYVTEASPSRPNSYYGANGQRPDSYADHGNGHSHNQRGNRPRHGNSRMNSDYNNGYGQQQHQQQQNYPNSPYTQSNDNITAGSGSANTDQWGNSTDPSSVNSSFDRLQQQQRYGQQQQQQDYYNNGAPPPPPPPHRQSFNQGGGGSGAINPALPAPTRRVMDDDDKKKRGSWLKRRFTKDRD